MATKMRVVGMILSFYPYLRSAMVRFPLYILVQSLFPHIVVLPYFCVLTILIFIQDTDKELIFFKHLSSHEV